MSLRIPRLGVEALEDRFLPTTYLVTTTRDLLNDTTAGEVTLRDVLTAINTQAPSGNAPAGTATNTVRFAIGAAGSVQTINVGNGESPSPLPALTHKVIIDGFSQGGANYSGPPLIVLNGAGAGKSANGLELDAGSSGSKVCGLVIGQFSNNGIEIKESDNNLITGNYIGTNAAGTAPAGNTSSGVLVDGGSKGNTIGGTTASTSNLLSGNGIGVTITGSGTSRNTVLGNLIGTDRTGTATVANVHGGLLIANGATDNTIGGTAPGSANVICHELTVPAPEPNPESGAAVLALGTADISGNIARFDIAINYADTPPAEMVYFSIDVRGSSSALAPGGDFSAFDFFPASTLGEKWAPVENSFAGEFQYQTPPPPGDQEPDGLAPNATHLIGTLTYDLSKFGITPSDTLSVSIAGTDTVVGAESPGDPTTFHFVDLTFSTPQQPPVDGGTVTGVEISGPGTSRNTVLGNLIGTNRADTARLGHFDTGVLIDDGATSNTVGGTVPGAANVIAGNNDGIDISGPGTNLNLVLGNRIGTDRSGTANFGNTVSGVFIDNGATANMVGGTVPSRANTIVFNGKGVVVGNSPADTNTVRNTILGNRIHDNVEMGIDLGNQGLTANGVNPRSAPNNGQNTPVITALSLNRITGTLRSVPRTTFRIEVYATSVGKPGNQGQVMLGFLNVTTSAAGNAAFTLPVALPRGVIVTATATNLVTGDTSEFSPALTQVLVTSMPVITASTGPQTVKLTAQVFTGNTPLPSGPVTFTIPGIPGTKTGIPDASGTVTVSFTVPGGTLPGRYSITVTVPGNEEIPTGGGESVLTILPGPPQLQPGKAGRRWNR